SNWSNQSCLACENNFCPEDPIAEPLCPDFASSADVTLCNDLMDCVRRSNCAANGVLGCYCGSVDVATCQSGGGNGVCKSQIEAGQKTTNPTLIINNYEDVSTPAGAVMSLIDCDRSFCKNECMPFCR